MAEGLLHAVSYRHTVVRMQECLFMYVDRTFQSITGLRKERTERRL